MKTEAMGLKRKRPSGKRLLAVTAAISALFLTATYADPFRIGVWAEHDADEIIHLWQPTVDHLNQSLPGHAFSLQPVNGDELLDRMSRGELDFAIIEPGLLLPLKEAAEAKVLATALTRLRDTHYAHTAGALLVQRDRRDITSPRDLRGRRIASGDSRSLGDWLSIKRELAQRGLCPDRHGMVVRFVGDPTAAVQDVMDGRADVAAVRAGTLEHMKAVGLVPAGTFKTLRFDHVRPEPPARAIPAVTSTRVYPGYLFVAGTDPSRDILHKVAAALIGMPPVTLRTTDHARPNAWTVPESDAPIHDCFRELRLPPYERYGEALFVDVVREHMYWFIAAGAAFILSIAVNIYITLLNRALAAEIKVRKGAEAALRESITRFEHIAACSSDWIWETDAEGHYIYSSSIAQQMIGYTGEELKGMHYFELFAAVERERLLAEGTLPLANGRRVFRERYRMRTKDGRVVIHETTAEPVRDENGRLAGYRGVNRDITDQVRFVRLRT